MWPGKDNGKQKDLGRERVALVYESLLLLTGSGDRLHLVSFVIKRLEKDYFLNAISRVGRIIAVHPT